MLSVDSLFDIDVTEKGGGFIYTLYEAGMDDPIFELESGSAWTSSEDNLRQMGQHLAYKYCEREGLVQVYAVANIYRGWFEVKFWYEKPARDTTVEFTRGINRPELLEIFPFEFLMPKGSYADNDVKIAMAVLRFGELRGLRPLTEDQ